MSKIGSLVRVSAAAALLSAAALPSAMAQTGQAPAAQTPTGQTPKAAPAGKSAAGRLSPEQAESKIADLHSRLKIAPDQESKWKPVAETMRENAQAMDAAIGEREAAWKTMGVVDDLKSYERMSNTYAKGLTKLVGVFEPFYNSLTPEQKKVADAEFGGYRQRAHAQTQ